MREIRSSLLIPVAEYTGRGTEARHRSVWRRIDSGWSPYGSNRKRFLRIVLGSSYEVMSALGIDPRWITGCSEPIL